MGTSPSYRIEKDFNYFTPQYIKMENCPEQGSDTKIEFTLADVFSLKSMFAPPPCCLGVFVSYDTWLHPDSDAKLLEEVNQKIREGYYNGIHGNRIFG